VLSGGLMGNDTIRNKHRWEVACQNNKLIIPYIVKYRDGTLTDVESEEFICFFKEMFYSIINKLIRKVVVPNYCDKEDLYQMSVITLFSCAKKFDLENENARFISYLRKALNNNLYTYLRVLTHNWKDITLKAEDIDDFIDEL